MNENAAGKGFERIELNFETFAELVGYFVPIEFGRNSLSETPRRLDRAIRRGKAMPGHQCRHHSGAGRGAGMHGLGHSAELLTQTGRLRRGDPQRHGGVFNIKLQQTRSEEHTSELQSLMRNSYAVFC